MAIDVFLTVLLRHNAFAVLGFVSAAIASLGAGFQALATKGWKRLYEWGPHDA